MGRAAAVLSRRRGTALAAALAGLVAWDALAHSLPALPDRLDVALIAVLLIPAAFAPAWLLLPVRDTGRLLPAALALVGLALVLDLAGLGAAFNATKLLVFTLLGFWFLRLFEELSWIVLVAAMVPWADIVSSYRGPTHEVVEEQPGVFARIAVEFAVPGSGAARIGPPDVLFFALFLAAAARFGLRAGATWLAMVACLGLTLVATEAFDLDGLPALPGIALGFLAPNADLLWRALRHREAPAEQRSR